MFFNEQGIVDIDELVQHEPSFQTIMTDGIVTEDELFDQSERIITLLHEAETRFSESDQQFIKKLLTETCVLSEVYHYFSIQNIR